MIALVVGGGVMGRGIAAVLALQGLTVEVADVDLPSASASVERIGELIDDAVGREKVTAAEGEAARGRLRAIAGVSDATAAPDVAIEAVPEQAVLKRSLLQAMERLGPALLATNTSALSIDALAEALEAPDRLIGMHFFNPVAAMKLVEVVVGTRTAREVTQRALHLVSVIGKEPIVVRDLPGFATSRLGIALGLEAIRMVEDGVATAEDIDTAMVLGYRHPVGPLRLTDIVGLDVRLAIARNLAEVYGPRFAPPALLAEMVEEGRLGRKTGRGFYRWRDGE
jgi:3-hydroxybutyryl-CoA dehydrogenase